MGRRRLNKKLAQWRWGELDEIVIGDNEMRIKVGEDTIVDSPFTESLDACFRWLVPKLEPKYQMSLHSPKLGVNVLSGLYLAEVFSKDGLVCSRISRTPAQAVCRAIGRSISMKDGEEDSEDSDD